MLITMSKIYNTFRKNQGMMAVYRERKGIYYEIQQYINCSPGYGPVAAVLQRFI